MNDDVLIVGSLKDDELRKSIDALVGYVEKRTGNMADSFVQSMDKMKLAMKDFAVTQKVSVDVMKQAWREMSSSFDAMVAAQSTATRGNGGTGSRSGDTREKQQYPDDTIGALKQEIALLEKKRDEMQRGTAELQRQNMLITERKNALRKETTSDASIILNSALNKQVSTLDEAKKKLGVLEQIQKNYANTTALSVAEQTKLAKAITQTKKQIDRLNEKRPRTLKEVMGMDEKSLDAITAKMRALKRVQLDPTNATQVKQLGDEYQRLKRLQSDLMGMNIQHTKSNNYLAQSFGYIRNRIVYALTLGAVTNFTKQVYEIRSQYELLERSLGVLVGSFQKGTEAFRQLNEMALKSPFTLMELGTAAKQLTAYDFSAKEVVDTTRRLADISAALGVPMERLTYNLGQIRAQTRLTARDARDFANAGLPIAKMLADYYSELEGQMVSTGDVYDRMTKKMVAYEDVMAVLYKVTDEGGKFFDFQAKQAETLRVQLANLTLAWNNMLNDIGKSNQGLLSAPVKGLKTLFENWKALSKTITDLVVVLGLVKVAQLAFNMSLSKGTIEQIKNIAANKASMAADYQAVFSKNALTKAQAKYLLATNGASRSLRKYIADTNLLTRQEYLQAKNAGAMQKAMYGMGVAAHGASTAIRSLATTLVALAPQMAALFAISAIVDFLQTLKERSDAVEEFGKTVRRNAEENVNAIKDLRDTLNFDDATQISEDDQIKAWERIRETIELTSASAHRYISILLQEDNMGERVNKAMEMLKAIEQIHAEMSTWKDDTVVVTNDFKVLGVGADGLSEDLKDFVKAMKEGGDKTKDVVNDAEVLESTWRRILERVYDYSDLTAYTGGGLVSPLGWLKNIGDFTGLDFLDSQKAAIAGTYQELSEEMDKFVDSLHKKLEKEGIEKPFQIKEALEQSLKDAAEAENWNEEQVLNARILAEQKFREKYKRELDRGDKDWNDALNGRTAAWEAWMTYLTRKNGTVFKDMATHEVSEAEWANSEQRRLYEETFERFKKENALAAQEVEQTVNDLSTLQVHIRVFYDQPAPLTDVEQDFRARTGQLERSEYFRTYAKGAKSQLEVIDNLKKGQKELQGQVDATEKAGGAYADEHLADMKKRNDTLIEMIHSYKALTDAEEKAEKEASKGKKDVIGDAFAKEVEIIQNIQKRYNEYREAGVRAQEAIEKATEEYGRTLIRVNTTLNKYGVKTKTSEELAGMDLRSVRDYYKSLLDMATALGNAKGVEALEKALAAVNVEITKFDYKKIKDGLNNELGKLKEEYELAVELDANPELGNMFADMIGLNTDALPRTIEQYAKQYADLVNKYLKDAKQGLVLPSLLLTDDDLRAFERMRDEGQLTADAYEIIAKAVKDVRDRFKKDNEQTANEWNKLVDKFGDLQSKLMKISKDTTSEIKNIINKFGGEDDKKLAVDLSDKIFISQDPQEIARLQEQLKQLLTKVTQGNPQATNIAAAIQNQQSQLTSKAFWEDFKNSDLYAMTFEDMAKNSTRAIQLIVNKLELLKEKVKEDPASMKALVESINKAQDELVNRNPLNAFIQSFGDLKKAKQEVKTAMEELGAADGEVDYWEDKRKQAIASGNTQEEIQATNKLTEAKKKQAKAQIGVATAENKEQKAKDKMVKSLEATQQAMEATRSTFNALSEAFRAFGDNDTADMLEEIANGFAMIIPIVIAVAIAIKTLESTSVILLAISAALSVIVGLVSWLSGNENKKITDKVEESERAVKRLENAYKNLQYAIEKAYGVATIGANKAAIANKELQLVELKRQLLLEQSRKSKDYDADKVEDLRGQIFDLEHEISDMMDNLANDLLGISSVGDAAQDMMSDFVDALRSGENAMDVFNEKIDDMIANMVTKMLVSKVIAPWFEQQWNTIQQEINNRGTEAAKAYEEAQRKLDRARQIDLDDNNQLVGALRELGFDDEAIHRLNWYENGVPDMGKGANARLRKAYADAIAEQEKKAAKAKSQLDKDTQVTVDDIRRYAEALRSGQPIMDENIQAIEDLLRELGLINDSLNEKELSKLQQGIEGITEDTAGAIEAYMNIVSQRVFEQNEYLLQIRDAVLGFDFDVQVATVGQILYQMQQSYIVQQAILSRLDGWSNANGMAMRVEMI